MLHFHTLIQVKDGAQIVSYSGVAKTWSASVRRRLELNQQRSWLVDSGARFFKNVETLLRCPNQMYEGMLLNKYP